jgi:uncharacterized membrane protein
LIYNILVPEQLRRITINAPIKLNKIAFRWQYIALPAGVFILTAILAATFYAQLPPQVAYHFQGGIPDRTVTPGVFLAWMIIFNVFFTMMSMFIVRIVMFWAKYVPEGEETPLQHLLPIMGNLMALPQIIFFAVMLQLVLYNVYKTGLIPLWIIALVLLVLGGAILGILFTRIVRKYRNKKTTINQETK